VQWRKWRKLIDRGTGSFKDEFGTWYRRTESVQIKEVDQVAQLLTGLKTDPYGRRHIISAWNAGELEDMALPPCHVMSQFWVDSGGRLHCHMYQRSVDVFLGLPFNIASYALLTSMIAHVCSYGVGELIISTGDTHIYNNHMEQVTKQLDRVPYPSPTLKLNSDITDLFKFKMGDIQLEGYQCHEQLKATMAV
jgi:thymidylate synthase